jgi:hypothetical protein
MWYALLADVVVAIHVLYVGFVLVGQVVLGVGLCRGWRWVGQPWLRLGHLVATGIVAVEAILGVPCPLTVWEQRLRLWAGQEVTGGSFIGRCLHGLLFYDFAPWVFTTAYVGFGLLALATFVLVSRRGLTAQAAER